MEIVEPGSFVNTFCVTTSREMKYIHLVDMMIITAAGLAWLCYRYLELAPGQSHGQ